VAPRRIAFAKAHGLGNDFLLVERTAIGTADPAELALRLCDHHTGLGADGLVVLGPSAKAAATFRIYNSDGSEAMLSGNALRCAAAWLLARGSLCADSGSSAGKADPSPYAVAAVSERMVLETRVGLRELVFLRRHAGQWIFRAEMGRPSFAASDVPFRPPSSNLAAGKPITDFPLPVGDEMVRATILSMGNPQCILFVDDWALLDWQGLGAEVERHPFFPDRTNVGFVRVLAPDRIETRFWERGAGHTLASGTGSCACAVAAHLAGKSGRGVTAVVERGEMEVNWREDDIVELTGPAEIVAEGYFQLES